MSELNDLASARSPHEAGNSFNAWPNISLSLKYVLMYKSINVADVDKVSSGWTKLATIDLIGDVPM